MVVPMVLPIIYTVLYKRQYLVEILLITLSMIFTVIAYWPLTTGFRATANIIPKYLLFVFFPFVILLIFWKIKKNNENHFELVGITENNLEKSFKLGLLLIPIMLLITLIVKAYLGFSDIEPDFVYGVVSFAESFTEEFFFRGLLFLLLISRTNFKVAYITSLASFILIHPQHFTNPFIIGTIAQGFLTLEICRRTKNLAGAWVLHGTNRFFTIVILPFFF